MVSAHQPNQLTPMLAAEARVSMVRIAETENSSRSARPSTRANAGAVTIESLHRCGNGGARDHGILARRNVYLSWSRRVLIFGYLVGGTAVVALAWTAVLRPRAPASRPPAPVGAGVVVRAAPLHATMDFESPTTAIRFGTPAAWKHQAHGFDNIVDPSADEPSSSIHRRAEVRLGWDSVAPRAAVLDLEVPQSSRFRVLRVVLNGHRVARLALSPGRRRYPFDLPVP